LDPLLASLLLVVLLPLLSLVGLAIVVDNPGPVFFRQVRVGKGGQPFTIYKFRRMTPGDHQSTTPVAANGELVVMPDDQRVTRFGRILRRSGLDEVPQLINIVLGQMVFIGPRAELPRYYDLVSVEQGEARVRVKPGITGLAQSSGRNSLTVAERIELDLEGITNRSFLLDPVICLRTGLTLLRGEGTEFLHIPGPRASTKGD
jgi:lipopolysaccharide/colanic/teichoic acid biosynthesis glycosyltransferase